MDKAPNGPTQLLCVCKHSFFDSQVPEVLAESFCDRMPGHLLLSSSSQGTLSFANFLAAAPFLSLTFNCGMEQRWLGECFRVVLADVF